MEFWEYLDKVGMMHVGRGRKHPLHVEYVHIGVCLGFIQDVIFEAVLSHPKLRMERKISVVKAIGKVLWIQNDLFAKWYVRDGDEFAGEMEEIVVEREGWLKGKQVIEGQGENVMEGDGNGEGGENGRKPLSAEVEKSKEVPSACPFSGFQAAKE